MSDVLLCGRALLVAASVLLAACYTYVPAARDAAPMGARVRAELKTGAPVEGRVVGGSAQGDLLLEVPAAAGDVPVGAASRNLFARITVHRDDLASLQLKKLNRTRTALVVGGSSALAALLVKLAFDTSSSGSETEGPPTNEVLIPIYSIHW